MLDLLWIFPNLNESVEVVKANLLKCFKYNVNRSLKSKIILSDGGSSYESVLALNKFVTTLKDNKTSSQMILNLPAMRPNKNLGILNIIEKYKSKYVVILDSDFLSLNKKCFDNIVNPLISGEAKMTLPNITRISGRSNKLIINPLLRLFYPKIAKKANFVLSGILGVEYETLKKIVTGNDYCWDWGGEIQIICKGFEYSLNAVKIFSHHREDAKRRSLSSKMKEARQIFRTILYELDRSNKLNTPKINEYLMTDWMNHKRAVNKFIKWQRLNHVDIINDSEDINMLFNKLLANCRSDKKWLFSYLDGLYNKTQVHEIAVLKSVTVDTALKTLFNINLKYDPVEVDSIKIMKTNMDNVSILADVIFAVYISLWLNERDSKKNNFQNYLDMLSLKDTDFTVSQTLIDFRKQGLGLVEIENIKPELLKRVIDIYNDESKSFLEKNLLLLKIMSYGRNRHN